MRAAKKLARKFDKRAREWAKAADFDGFDGSEDYTLQDLANTTRDCLAIIYRELAADLRSIIKEAE